MKGNLLSVNIPSSGNYELTLLGLNGAILFKTNANGNTTTTLALPKIKQGTYMLKCGDGLHLSIVKVAVCR
jgi:hypothetical protein